MILRAEGNQVLVALTLPEHLLASLLKFGMRMLLRVELHKP